MRVKNQVQSDWVPSEDNLAYANGVISQVEDGKDYTRWELDVTVNAVILGEIFWLSVRDPKGPSYAMPISLWATYPDFMAQTTYTLEKLRKLAHLAQDRAFYLKAGYV